MATDSLKKRYFAKLSANLVGLLVGLVTEMMIPRALGPRSYGNFAFLSNFLQQIINFLEMGTSTAFYVKLSQRRDEFGLVSFYFAVSVIICFVLFLVVLCCHMTGTYMDIFRDQKIFYIYLATCWAVLGWIVLVLQRMVDAYGLTVSAEIAKIVQKVLGLSLILMLFIFHQLNLAHLFYYHFFIIGFLIVAFIWLMNRRGYLLKQNWRLSRVQVSGYIEEFYSYSHPLFILSLGALVVGLMDRWLLQYFGGSVQQGLFGISFKIGAICFLFSSAMTTLITREFAISFENGDVSGMGRLFRRYVPILYCIAAYFGCFTAVQADRVVNLVGGGAFGAASTAMIVMAFYPISQTLGQLVTSLFYATGQTRLYRNISLFFMVISLPMTYFFLASKDKMGLDLGATGLAVKIVSLQFISVNVRLFFSSGLIRLRFWKYITHQFGVMSTFVALAYISRHGIDWIPGISDRVVAAFICSGVVYSALVVGLVTVFPIFLGFSNDDMNRVRQMVIRFSRKAIMGG